MKDIQDLLQERIARMVSANPSRINFYENIRRSFTIIMLNRTGQALKRLLKT